MYEVRETVTDKKGNTQTTSLGSFKTKAEAETVRQRASGWPAPSGCTKTVKVV